MNLFRFAAFIAISFLAGCTDAERASWVALGDPGTITCYSGGQVIYEGKSTGKILTESQSDGWLLQDAATGRLVRVSGDCVIRN
jgi:hypothetical protein